MFRMDTFVMKSLSRQQKPAPGDAVNASVALLSSEHHKYGNFLWVLRVHSEK